MTRCGGSWKGRGGDRLGNDGLQMTMQPLSFVKPSRDRCEETRFRGEQHLDAPGRLALTRPRWGHSE